MPNITKQLKSLPASPGIYLFYNSKRELIYVGKATSLKSRVKSYFTGKQKSPRPIESMIDEVKNIKTIKTDSVLEAIILEGQYIKKYRPKYNVDWKDDKSWNYLYLTNEPFPKLKTIRQHEIHNSKFIIHNSNLFGPFPSLNTRETLKLLHKLFYISRCSPPFLSPPARGGAPRLSGRGGGRGKKPKPCFDYQLGQCLGVCTGEITTKEYKQKVIKPLNEFLKGNKKRLLQNLKKQMLLAAKQQNFEEATRLRNQINNLKKIQDVSLLNKNLFHNDLQITNYRLQITRIEAYDISNLGPTGKVGSMVVFDQSGPLKSEYRKFKIKTVAGQSDVDCLKEIIERRLKNNWPLPDLILVDGGTPQVNAVQKIIKLSPPARGGASRRLVGGVVGDIPVIGIAKGPTRQKNEFIFDKNNQKNADFIQANENLLINARDEAHRFAISYQKKLRKTT